MKGKEGRDVVRPTCTHAYRWFGVAVDIGKGEGREDEDEEIYSY
jgi:hypothetical protein